MSAKQIHINFEEALAVARQLEDLSADMERNVSRSMGDSMQDLSAAWKGESANAYLRKAEQLKGNVSTTSTNLREIAEDIRTTARQLKQAEMKAICIAQTQ